MQNVYQQVIITCTTINVIIGITAISSIIWMKISEHREKKRKKREEQELAEMFVDKQ
jgi:hypothetical protein